MTELNIDLKYVINSNVNFAKHSLKVLIPSMLDCGIEHKNILVILGGSDDNSVKFINTGMFMCLNVKMNAIDQTSFYTIKKNCHLFPKHIYYMHDTTKAGPNFKTNIEKYYEVFKKNNLKTLKNTRFYSSNMGFYDRDFIINTLNSKKCYSENESIYTDEINPNNPDNLKLKKDVGFKLEDAIFAQDLEENNMGWAISDTMAQFSDKVDIYNTQNERTVAYYDKLDLYKYYGNTFISKDNKLNNNLNCKI